MVFEDLEFEMKKLYKYCLEWRCKEKRSAYGNGLYHF